MKRRRVLVTGGSRGIGKEICKLMSERGYDVVAPTREALNMSDPESIDRYFSSNGAFDILVNNAGINLLASIDQVLPAQWLEMVAINLTGPLQLIQRVVPHMRERGWGRILNMSSIFSNLTRENRVQYSATKSGLNGITRTAALELGPSGILVNSVCPGYVETQLTFQNNSPADIERILSSIPLRRMAKPSEIADLVEFLCSERNTYLTGQMITVDGGFSIQ